jgi:hypothetical protein
VSRGSTRRQVDAAAAGLNFVEQFLKSVLSPTFIDSGRGAGRVPGQSIKWPRRSKNPPGFQGKRECARRRRQMGLE